MKGRLSDSLSFTSFTTRIFPSLAVALRCQRRKRRKYRGIISATRKEMWNGARDEGGRRKPGAGFVIGAFSVSTLKITALICGGARALADSLIGAERFARWSSSENAVADSYNRVPTFQRTQSIKSFVENLNQNRRLASPVLKNNAMHVGVLRDKMNCTVGFVRSFW